MLHFNRTIKNIHLWLGISCGLLASISGLTGSLYVWQPEITAALNPKLLTATQIDTISEGTLLRTASFLMEMHKDSLTRINLPYREQQTISLIYKNGETHYHHPQTATFLGTKSASIQFFEDLLNIHRTLAIPKIGKYIMGGSSIIFLLLILGTGIYIWWKAYGNNFKKGFNIKWKGKKLNYDLHKVLGVGFFIPLAIIAFSGAYFTYNSYYKAALTLLDSSKLAQNQNTVIQPKFTELTRKPDTIYALRAIYFPKESNGEFHFRYIQDRFIEPGLRRSKELKLTETDEVSSLTQFHTDLTSNKIAAQFYPVHTGEIAGFFGRILVFISGLVPITLYITGFRIYFTRKEKQLKRPKCKK
ncbi:PepSY domain-containing protein [Arenibacter sp. H213]|nr:PepSY domain-containing protein [Arenibacter sp. H213]